MKTFGKAILATFGVIVALFLAIVIISSLNRSKQSQAPTPTVNTGTPVTTTAASVSTSTPTPTPTQANIVLMDNEYITLSYEKMTSEDYGEGLKFYRMIVYATNKSNQNLTFFLLDGSVNDEMATIVSGHEVLAGKSGRFICTINAGLLSIDSIDQIKKVEFDVHLQDEHWNDIVDPEKVRLDF